MIDDRVHDTSILAAVRVSLAREICRSGRQLIWSVSAFWRMI
jgi:hypothetical protein